MKKTVCVDLDDVLADYSKGWQGEDVIGNPIPGAREFLRELGTFAKIVILTTRCKVDISGRPAGVTAAQLQAKVSAWLDLNVLHYDEVYAGQGKPIAAAYVDDRGVVCEPRKYGRGDYDVALERCRQLCEAH